MKIKRIYATDFMSFKTIDLSFDQINGLNLIEGWNADDNSASGAGKTALMDLISFVPFGESPRGLKVNEFINDNATKGCIAGLELETDTGSIVTIERSRKPEDLHYVIDDGDPVRGGNIRETQAMIESLLKLDFNTFINSVYFTQNANMKFISASDTEKRDILTRILDLSDFDKAYESADLQIKALETSKIALSNESNKYDSIKNLLLKDIEDLKIKSDKFHVDQKTLITSKSLQVQSIETKIKDAQTIISVLETKPYEMPPFQVQEPDLSELDQEQQKLKDTVFETVDENIEKPDNSDLNLKAEDLIKKIQVKSKIEAKIKEIEKERTEINFELKTNDKVLSDILSTGTGTCPKCRQDVSESHLKQEADDIQSKQNELSIRLTALSLDKFNEALDKINEAERGLNKIESDKNAREKEYNNILKNIADKKSKINQQKLDIERRISGIEQQKQSLLREYSNAEKLYAEKLKQIEIEKLDNSNRIKEQYNAIDRYKDQINDINKDIKLLSDSENPFISSIQAKDKSLFENELKCTELFNKVKDINEEVEVLTVLKASYKNVKYYIFESTIDELNLRIDKYLEPLFNEDVKVKYEYVSGKNSDKLKFETKILKNGIEKTFQSLSDGEKKRAELATNFALSDIVSLRKSNSFSLMLLDEVFNGLPEECRERVVELLETLKNEKESILIIDHFKAVGTLIEKTIRVEKKNGISVVINE